MHDAQNGSNNYYFLFSQLGRRSSGLMLDTVCPSWTIYGSGIVYNNALTKET